jgi:hypothetical protein
MTWRGIILGFLGVIALASFNYVNDNILKQTYLLGNYLPVAVYGVLILVVIGVNPLLGRIRRGWLLSGREIAVALTIVLASTCIPGDSLLRCFTTSLVLPHHFSRTNPGWTERQVLQQFPPRMLVAPGADEDRVVNGFVQGLGEAGRHIGLLDIPWHAWARTFAFWLPLLGTVWLAFIALSVVVHKQWSEHELLPYPIADFAHSLLPAAGQATSTVLRSRGFWVACGAVFLLHFNNFLQTFFPEALVPITRQFNFVPLITWIPGLAEGGGWLLMNPTVFFSVLGFAYFVPQEVSFSLGIGPFLWCMLCGFLAKYGFSLTTSIEGASWYLDLKPQTSALLGANLAVFLVILFCGRRYYADVLRQALAPWRRERLVPGPATGAAGRGYGGSRAWGTGTADSSAGRGESPSSGSLGVDPAAVWAARLAMLCFALLLAQMAAVGLDWQLAGLYIGVTIVFYVVVSRVFAETGLFYCQPFFFPCVAVWSLFGSAALGPQPLGIMLLLTTMIMVDPRESLMPLIVNNLKLLERQQLRLGRGAWLFAAAVLVCLAVALPVTLYFQYDLGYAKWDTWGGDSVPQMACRNVANVHDKLKAMGVLDETKALHGWERFRHLTPEPSCAVVLGAAFAVTLLVYVARLRIPGWPLHPVLFLTWPTYPAALTCASFLLGLATKGAIVRYGGASLHQRLKPVFLGLIVGEIFGAFVPTVVGVFYYLFTGLPPAAFRVLPS